MAERIGEISDEKTLEQGSIYNGISYDGTGGVAYVEDTGKLTGKEVTFSRNTAIYGGAIGNEGTAFFDSTTFSGNTAFGDECEGGQGGAIYNKNTLTLGSVTFSGNTATGYTDEEGYTYSGVGGAIYNEGTINLTGVVTLATETDTWYNDYDGSTVNWDLTKAAPGASVCINGYEYFSSGTNTITVTKAQTAGQYVLATWNSSEFSPHDDFTLICDDEEESYDDVILSADGMCLLSDRIFTLTENDSSLVLDVSAQKTVITTHTVITDEQTLAQGSVYCCEDFEDKGAAILVESTGILNGNDVVFIDNGAECGGAVCNDGGKASFSNTAFSNNLAYDNGGAIHNFGGYDEDSEKMTEGILSLDNVTFTSNSAEVGGAICNFGGKLLTVTASKFTSNSSSGEGGAIYTCCNYAEIDDENAEKAIPSLSAGTLSLDTVTFKRNRGSDGGAIYNKGSVVSMNNAVFYKNYSEYGGGAIFNTYEWIEEYDDVTEKDTSYAITGTMSLDNVTFKGNHADNGGAIYNKGGTISLSNAEFSKNSSLYDGGAINNYCDWETDSDENTHTINGVMSLDNVTFTGNTAAVSDADGLRGGGAICTRGTMTITSGTFSENTVGWTISLEDDDEYWDEEESVYSDGGAIFNDGGTLSLNSGLFSGNTANGRGGAIFNTYGCETVYDEENDTETSFVTGGTLTLDSVTFSGNSVSSTAEDSEDSSYLRGRGGAIYNDGGIVTVTSANFSGNEAAYVIKNEDWDWTTPKGYGGAIYNCGNWETVYDEETETETSYAVGGTMTLNSVTFSGNRTNYGGGAIYNDGGSVIITSADFSGNAADGVYVYSDESEEGVVTSGTYSLGCGGAIYNDGGTTSLASVTFTGNTACVAGGAIYNASQWEYTDEADFFIVGSMSLDSADFSGNSAANGGAIYNTGNLTLTTGSFNGNTAEHNGGAVSNSGYPEYDEDSETYSISGGTMILDSVTFSGNSAAEGGAVHNDGGVMTITSGTFAGNTALYVEGADKKHSKSGLGGAIYNGNLKFYEEEGGESQIHAGTLSLGSVTFSGNSAAKGGAIYNDGTLILNGQIRQETATDTIVNNGIMIWDLTGAETGSIGNYDLLSNDQDASLYLSIRNAQLTAGNYVLASGASGSLAGKDTFTITLNNDVLVGKITVGQEAEKALEYQGHCFELCMNGTDVVLHVDSKIDLNNIRLDNRTLNVTADLTPESVTFVKNGNLNAGDHSVHSKVMTVEGAGNSIIGDAVSTDSFNMNADSELSVSRAVFDTLLSSASMDAKGNLMVEDQGTQDELKALTDRSDLYQVTYLKGLGEINKLELKNQHAFGFTTGIGTAKNDTITIAKGAEITFGSKGGTFDMQAGTNTLAVKKGAAAKFLGTFSNVSKFKTDAGTAEKNTTVEAENLNFSEGTGGTLSLGKFTSMTVSAVTGTAAADKLSLGANNIVSADALQLGGGTNTVTVGAGASLTAKTLAGEIRKIALSNGSASLYTKLNLGSGVTGTAKADTLSFGNYADVTMGSWTSAGGNDKLRLGKYSVLKAGALELTGSSSVSLGAFSRTELGPVTGVNKLTVTAGNAGTRTAADIAGTVTGTAMADTLSLGNYTDTGIGGSIVLADGNDKVNVGKYANFTSGALELGSGKNSVTFNAYSESHTGAVTDVNKLTVKAGAAADLTAVDIAGDVTGTAKADTFSFGNYTDVNIHGSVSFAGNDKVSTGKGSVLVLKSADATGLKSLKLGKDSVAYLSAELCEKASGKNATVHDIGSAANGVAQAFTDLESEQSDNVDTAVREITSSYNGWLDSELDTVDYVTVGQKMSLTATDSSDLKVSCRGLELSFSEGRIDLAKYAGATLKIELASGADKSLLYQIA